LHEPCPLHTLLCLKSFDNLLRGDASLEPEVLAMEHDDEVEGGEVVEGAVVMEGTDEVDGVEEVEGANVLEGADEEEDGLVLGADDDDEQVFELDRAALYDCPLL
jgi:hypothetical protein